jgi:hypothetical protein
MRGSRLWRMRSRDRKTALSRWIESLIPTDTDGFDPHPLIKRPACRPVKHQQCNHANYKGGLPRLIGMGTVVALASPPGLGTRTTTGGCRYWQREVTLCFSLVAPRLSWGYAAQGLQPSDCAPHADGYWLQRPVKLCVLLQPVLLPRNSVQRRQVRFRNSR